MLMCSPWNCAVCCHSAMTSMILTSNKIQRRIIRHLRQPSLRREVIFNHVVQFDEFLIKSGIVWVFVAISICIIILLTLTSYIVVTCQQPINQSINQSIKQTYLSFCEKCISDTHCVTYDTFVFFLYIHSVYSSFFQFGGYVIATNTHVITWSP